MSWLWSVKIFIIIPIYQTDGILKFETHFSVLKHTQISIFSSIFSEIRLTSNFSWFNQSECSEPDLFGACYKKKKKILLQVIIDATEFYKFKQKLMLKDFYPY